MYFEGIHFPDTPGLFACFGPICSALVPPLRVGRGVTEEDSSQGLGYYTECGTVTQTHTGGSEIITSV